MRFVWAETTAAVGWAGRSRLSPHPRLGLVGRSCNAWQKKVRKKGRRRRSVVEGAGGGNANTVVSIPRFSRFRWHMPPRSASVHPPLSPTHCAHRALHFNSSLFGTQVQV